MVELLYFGMWAVYLFSLPKMLHIIQLEGYKNRDFIKWFYKNGKIAMKSGIIQFALCVISLIITIIVDYIILKLSIKVSDLYLLIKDVFILGVFYITNIILIDKNNIELKKAKKPLAYTARTKRLIASNFAIMIILEVLFMGAINNRVFLYSFLILTIPLNMILANWFISPTEDVINNYYINSAKRKLRKNKNLIRIGITGSYGKTSTKFILENILSEKYSVLATPESYNTTMGNVRTIRENLKPQHEIFISEMGARNRYDIREICNFVNPQIAIITSIGAQHLETFKKLENVIRTKYELVEGLTKDGVVFLPKDDKNCYDIYVKEKKEKYLYSMKDKNADVYAKDITVSEMGSTFTVVYKKEEFKCTTKLLGEHNVQNILGCIAIAFYLDLTKEQIIKGVEKVEPVPHRLQILPTTNGTIVIDDAFNSNPVGSKIALDILKKFDGRKIIITPGMVELGKEEYNLNKEFGSQMAEAVNIAILVGEKRSKPIVEGLREKKFNDMDIYVVKDLNGATKKLAEISKLGDVILFENDLPDNYNE